MTIKELAEYQAMKHAGVGIGAPEPAEVKKVRAKAWDKALLKAEKEAKVKREKLKKLEASKHKKSKAE